MNKTQKQLDRIAQFLGEQTTLSMATTGDDGQPCVAPLFYFVDESLSLYWFSSPASLHSRNLLRTPRAAATVYCAAQSWQEIRGVQMRGPVSIVTEPQCRAAITKGLCERFKLGRVLRLAVRQSVLCVLQPEFFRYIDNSHGFGTKFELSHTPQGWTRTHSAE
ncbi:MAG: pyridoxamine 5'-phosphate oxidase family protein [Terracidiphilus sp.]